VTALTATLDWAGPLPVEDSGDDSWLGALRREAYARAAAQGFPTRKHEDWRYTRLAPLLALELSVAADAPAPEELAALDARVPDLGGARVVFVNGHLDSSRSRLGGDAAGFRVKALAQALVEDRAVLEAHLRAALATSDTFGSLNTAFAADGAYLVIDEEAVIEAPLHLVFLQSRTAGPLLVSPRTVVVAGAHSRATVVESYYGAADGCYLDNAVTEIVLGAGATLSHYKVQLEGEQAFHLAALDVRQGRDSHFSSQSLALGGAIARHEVQVHLTGEGASAEVNGLFMPHGEQQHDNPTTIAHDAGHCVSRELYKGVVDDRAHGVFNGRVLVALDAGGTDASQANKNLLLSDQAEVDTRPRLEILADDVKVSHGAAVGQLDDEALFYLRSRGIPEEAARQLLISGFVGELLERFEPALLRSHVHELVAERVPVASRAGR